MTAKEMFENLDYYWKEDNSCISFTKILWKHWIFKSKITICFWKLFKEVSIYEESVIDLSLEELQAINKQVEELGWNNENNRYTEQDSKL